MKKVICLLCLILVIIATLAPSIVMTFAASSSKEVTLSDNTSWLLKTNSDYNTFSTDGKNKYSITTTKPDDQNSEFSIISKNTYSRSTKYQLQCWESAGAMTYFGLSLSTSLDMKNDDSIFFIRQNGFPSENAVKISAVTSNGTETITNTSPNYTRSRVSTIGVTKQNGSWYMTWNDIVLNGDGCDESTKEYCKLENHFPMSYLENDATFHFYAGASSLHINNGFFVKPDRVFKNGAMIISADTYEDPNASSNFTAISEPSVTTNDGSYTMSFSDTGTYAAPMIPVTQIDESTGKSQEFNVEAFIDKREATNRYWMEYAFSNDPTFSDGTEIRTWNALLGDQGFAVHFGYQNGSTSVTSVGVNSNYYNDPQQSTRYFWFERDNNTGKTFLYFWGPNLTAKATPHCIDCDFTSLTGKPIYVRVYSRNLCGSKIKIKVTPNDASNKANALRELEQEAQRTPTDLNDAEQIISIYDSSPYKYAVDSRTMSKILETKNYTISEENAKINAELTDLRNEINKLPTVEELLVDYVSSYKEKITSLYMRYIQLGDYKSGLETGYVDKLISLLNALKDKDSEIATKKTAVDEFENNVTALGNVNDYILSNYENKTAEIVALRQVYNNMDELEKALVNGSSLLNLSGFESRMVIVKEAVNVAYLISSLPDASNIHYSDSDAINSAENAYNLLLEKSLITSDLLEHLKNCKNALEEAKLHELDWYSKNDKVKYTGDNTNGYSFENTQNQISDDVFSTTTSKYNMVQNQLYWVGMGCGSSQFALLGLSSNICGQILSSNSTDNISFILRPGAGNCILVTFYDSKGESERIAEIESFDMGATHTYSFEKSADNHWYLKIDNTLCNAYHYDRFDEYMNNYAEGTYVSIGGRNGFAASGVAILNENVDSNTGDWTFSLPFGCSYKNDNSGLNVSLKAGAQAVYKNKLNDLSGWSFDINLNIQSKPCSDTLFGFLYEPDSSKVYDCSSKNGVVVRLINRPVAGDNRTHILLLLNGKWVTITAKEPAIIDADYFNVSIEKSNDKHYYLRIKWESGSYLVKFERSSDFYRLVQMDKLVENGAYFTIISNNMNISSNMSMTYSPVSDNGDTQDNTTIINYILEFEEHFDKLKELSVEDYEYMHEKWLELNFLDRNSVAADLMDDDAAYNLLRQVMNYKDGDLDEYQITENEVLVSKDELDSLVESYNSKDDGEYSFVYASDGSPVYTAEQLKSLYSSFLPVAKKIPINQKDNKSIPAQIILAALLCSEFFHEKFLLNTKDE